MASLPDTQCAVQLVGPGELRLNEAKAVPAPGPHEVVLKVQTVGLCFSDLKLLKQFDQHARKSEVVGGIDPAALGQVQSYVPGSRATVPGHEVVGEIVAVGDQVKHHRVGERVLVQTDYRDLPTAGSNAAFGYNFEGGLQEYTVMDERVIIDKRGERFLIPVGKERSGSAVALVEPWACVEDSYVNRERQRIKAGGRLAVIAHGGYDILGLKESFDQAGPPAGITAICEDAKQLEAIRALGMPVTELDDPAALEDEAFDDIVYYGDTKETIEILNDKLASRGIINIVLAGMRIGEEVNVGVGRVHYGMTRWIGTPSASAADSYDVIPATGEIRDGERILVVGAGGPMGQMHVIRNLCEGVPDVRVVATDFDDARLQSLGEKAGPLAEANGLELEVINPQKTKLDETFTYIALMAPVPALVEQAIHEADDGCIINIFAGIPAPTKHLLDLDTYIEKGCFMFGTSGSSIEDMKIVLRKVESGKLDTNVSVDAICGMAGAIDGIKAVENRTLAGKIIVYPMLRETGLVPLAKLERVYPSVAAKLEDGQWTKAAEDELLAVGK